MNPPQACQLIVIERLHAKADAGDAGGAKRLEPHECGGFGIGLESDFGVWREIVCRPAGFDEPCDLRRIEKRGSAAAEEDGVCGPAIAGVEDLLLDCLDVTRLQIAIEQAAIEIAVTANGRTKRDVEIQAQHDACIGNLKSGNRQWQTNRQSEIGNGSDSKSPFGSMAR